MQENKIFKELLLLTQEELALLLGVTRSQLTMYTSGYRDLSGKGKTTLQQLIRVVHKMPFSKKEAYSSATEINLLVKNMAIDNKLKQLKLKKQLVNAQEKYQAALNTLHFVTILETEKGNPSVLQLLKNKANTVLKTNGLDVQESYMLKLKVLEYEEMLLQKKLK